MSDIKTLTDAVCGDIDAARGELVDLCDGWSLRQALTRRVELRKWPRSCGATFPNMALATEIVKADDEALNVVSQVDGHSSGRHVVFNAHMDTMEAGDESAWSVPVFKLSKAEGRLYGLGMGNMKGALAAMCLATAALHRQRNAWQGRLSMTAVSDEVMFGERGAVLLLKRRPDLAGDFMISGEGPGFMDFAVAEKGLLWVDIEVKGPPGHSSRALAGSTAVMKLAVLLARLDEINGLYATPPAELTGITGGDGNLGLRVSLNAGNLAAGTVRSQIATRAYSQLDIRLPPGISAKNIEAANKETPAPVIQTSALRSPRPGTPIGRRCKIRSWWSLPLRRKSVRGKKPNYVVRLPGSDARRWRDLGVPAVCYGPQPMLSAGIDDYANEQDVVDCAKIYARTALRLMSLGG